MLKWLQALIGVWRASANASASTVQPGVPPVVLSVDGAPVFHLEPHIRRADDLPIVHWAAVGDWVRAIDDPATQAKAWDEAELAWLSHLRGALGGDYRVLRQHRALLLSTLEPNVAQATLEYMATTRRRIGKVLDGLARFADHGHDILIVLDGHDAYYRYVAPYYDEAGEFATSGGVYLDDGCGHYVTMKDDLRSIEPVIVHEMTHGAVRHLPLPAWLNEGLAVNVEDRLSPSRYSHWTPQQLHAKHKAFWNADTVQQFWSGKSFLTPGDGNLLSYELARILVAHFGARWDTFKAFALAAHVDDAGNAAAQAHLGTDLGAAVCSMLERAPAAGWSPDPARWDDPPERGAFSRRGVDATRRSADPAPRGTPPERSRPRGSLPAFPRR